jgi:putative colanic acid biosynthesis UDP-glucose lipid carrier transferase
MHARHLRETGQEDRLIYARPILSNGSLVVKEILDRALAAVAALFLAPLLLVISAIVKLDSPGPVFYRQQRHGLGRRVFSILKFRTLHWNQCDPSTGAFTEVSRNDPRVTRVGRFLRLSFLDELPQVLNVLKGDMSLVGPRPHAIYQDEQYEREIPAYPVRYLAKPGMTGWAQINGLRGEVRTLEEMVHRVEHDQYYVEHWSLLLDLWILARTPLSVIQSLTTHFRLSPNRPFPIVRRAHSSGAVSCPDEK